jgi:PAS domain S-box-containing protein
LELKLKDKDKTKKQLVNELVKLQQRIRKSETSETKRKQREQIFKESEEKYRLLVETSADMIFTVDLKGNFLFVNKAFKKNLGYAVEEIKKINGFSLVHPKDLASVRKQFALILEGKNASSMEYRYKKKDGSYIHILNNASPIFDSEGNVVAAFGVARDINQRKKMEEELQKAHDKLERRVKERTAKLLTSNKKLKKEIEERRRIEKELRESEEKYRAIFESFHDVCYRTDREGRITIISPSVQTHAGYDPKEVIGHPVTDFYLYPSDRKIFLQKLKESGVINDYELKLKAKDGRVIDTSVSSRILFGKDGVPVGVEGVLRDITERKQAEEELKTSEERLKILFEFAPDAYYLNDLKGNFIDGNIAAEKITGYPRNELIGKNFFKSKILPLAQIRKAASLLAQNARGQATGPDEFILNRKDGTQVPVEIRTFPVKIKGETLVLGIARDITERMKAEEVLRESEEKFRNVAEQSPNMIFINRKGRVVYANKKCEELMGYKKKKFYSPDFDFFRLIAPDSRDLVKASFSKHMKGKEISPYEYVLINKEGQRMEAIITTKLVSYEGDRAILGIITDITERKQAEEQIKASLIEKEVLLKEVHHRVKNNMQIISSLLNLQSRHIKEEQALKIFKNSQNRVKSMSLIHERLYQSKDLARINFAEYARGLGIHLFNSYGISSKTIKFHTNIKNVFLDINTAIPCGLIINELVSNSLKHAFPDGKKGEIKIAMHPLNGNEIELIVSDNGIGIPKEVDIKKTESLGLHLVTILAEEQLHGKIKLDRAKGTSYQIKLKMK